MESEQEAVYLHHQWALHHLHIHRVWSLTFPSHMHVKQSSHVSSKKKVTFSRLFNLWFWLKGISKCRLADNQGRGHMGNPFIDGWTVLKWILEKEDVIVWILFYWFRLEPNIEFWVFMNTDWTCGFHRNMKSLDQVHNYQLKAELHKIPARVQCTVQCADWIDEPAPPTIP
jgi:hypothetical protein